MELFMCTRWPVMGIHSSDTNVRLQVGSNIMDGFLAHSSELKNIIYHLYSKAKKVFSLNFVLNCMRFS
jgi:hypothetical protein